MRIGGLDEWRRWLAAGDIAWGGLLLLVLGVLALWWFGPTEQSVRRLGFAYESVGLLVVIVEIARANRKHERQRLDKRFAAYLARMPLFATAPRVIHASMNAALGGVFGRARGTSAPPSDAAIEERVAFLERSVQRLDDRVEAVDSRIEAEVTARSRAVSAEQAEREAADSLIERQIKDLEVGGLDLSFFGVVFLAIGMVLTTGTPEICWVLNCR